MSVEDGKNFEEHSKKNKGKDERTTSEQQKQEAECKGDAHHNWSNMDKWLPLRILKEAVSLIECSSRDLLHSYWKQVHLKGRQ